MENKATIQSAFESADIKQEVANFLRVYDGRPIRNNYGGMRVNHSFATWFILKTLRPATVIESGVWNGHSTWLIEQVCPNAKVFSIDPDLSHLAYRSAKSTYENRDFAQCAWTGIDPAETVCLFDDHQNAYQRLKDLRWAGFTRAIFDDNFPCGEGDCYTLRHVLNGFGHEQIQMSKAYQGNWNTRRLRRKLEAKLRLAGARQQMITPKNTVDRELFQKNCAEYFEFPPIVLTTLNDWGLPYEGHYAGKAPIHSNDLPDELRHLIANDSTEASYTYLAYVTLKSTLRE